MKKENEGTVHRDAPLTCELKKSLDDTQKSIEHLHKVGNDLRRESEVLLKEIAKRASDD